MMRNDGAKEGDFFRNTDCSQSDSEFSKMKTLSMFFYLVFSFFENRNKNLLRKYIQKLSLFKN